MLKFKSQVITGEIVRVFFLGTAENYDAIVGLK
jgi:hypothetical protein